MLVEPFVGWECKCLWNLLLVHSEVRCVMSSELLRYLKVWHRQEAVPALRIYFTPTTNAPFNSNDIQAAFSCSEGTLGLSVLESCQRKRGQINKRLTISTLSDGKGLLWDGTSTFIEILALSATEDTESHISAQDYSVMICAHELKICESNLIPVRKREPPWLP